MNPHPPLSFLHPARSLGLALLLSLAPAAAQDPPQPRPAPDPASLEKARSLLAERAQLDETVWAQEREAQRHEQTLVRLWDALLAEQRKDPGDAFAVFTALPLRSLLLGKAAQQTILEHGIESISLQPGQELSAGEWKEWLAARRADGFRLIQSEWHHARFDAPADGPPRSEVSVVLHVAHQTLPLRLAIDGKLRITWTGEDDAAGLPIPDTVDASGLRILRREGTPAFVKWFTHDPSTPGKPAGIHPLIAQDLDGDGRTELIAAGCNTVFTVDREDKVGRRPFLDHPARTAETGIVADLTGDGIPDYGAPDLRGDFLLYRGAAGGSFPAPPVGSTREGGPLRQPTTITAGDIDGDGDLDLWIGQYRISYLGGAMPDPYYDANDGFPAFLLLNEGGGRFAPHTEEAGLAPKSQRRTYSSALVDLDDDHDLDLLVVSDFAGVDVYQNDGRGRFIDVTDTAVDERHLFGMSATFADYNLDGLLDFYVAGMGSTTARRLEQMGARRDDDPAVDRMRMIMGYGNRMYVRIAGSLAYRQPDFRDHVARTGWTWGTTSPDFDNDGDRDLFVANGHSSGASTKDHCTHFWCHDIYKPTSQPDPARNLVFQFVHRGYFDRSESWDGYQKSHLLMNRGGADFVNIAFLMGVADEFDGRAALSEDLDGDGRMELLLVEDRWSDGQILHVYRNVFETDNHWIGVRLRDEPEGRSPLGARVRLTMADGRVQPAAIVAGETLHGQHSSTVHFGLGAAAEVRSVEVIWPGGHRRTWEKPAVDRYHDLSSR